MRSFRKPKTLLLALSLLIALSGCFSRREVKQLESADFGLVLLSAQSNQPLVPELKHLYDATRAQLGALPPMTRGWLNTLAPALQTLEASSLSLATAQPALLQQALSPYRGLAHYPVLYEQLKVPADAELAPVAIQANEKLKQAWRVNGALWIAEQLEPLLRREASQLSQRDPTSRTALGVAATSQLYLLLQASESSIQLAADLDQLTQQALLRQDILRARLQAQPSRGIVLNDDIQLMGSLIQTLRHARTHLYESDRSLQGLTLTAGDRLQLITKSLP